ncbi:hypothetical protein CRV24_008950 [Beauveria bassiana]|nr:hypothetical protein CRV24_008950 [Beauveria bassiana]
MGSLMNKSDPACRHDFRTPAQCGSIYAVYQHRDRGGGADTASAAAAEPIRHVVQQIEKSCLKACRDEERFKIMFVHPRIQAARDDIYEYWPTDRVDEWIARYPGAEVVQRWKSRSWDVKQQSSQ